MHPILSAITTNEISILNTLLFPPPSLTTPPSDLSPIILINWLDSKGLAPIHYAVSVEKPKIEIIDALYKAGADMNFCASWKKSTALHCLARFARDEHLSTNPDPPTMEKLLFYFTVHLVKHLKASLAARDSSGESCLHIAAEHGESAAVLRALIYCDEDRSVREMRNDRG
jgi:ankyrin repeat protein